MRTDQVVNHVSVLDLLIVARRATIDRHGVYEEIPTDPHEISDWISKIYRRYIKQLFPDCYARKNKYAFSIRLDNPAFKEMYGPCRDVQRLNSRYFPSTEARSRVIEFTDRLYTSINRHQLIEPYTRSDGTMFIYLPHTTRIYNHSGHLFSDVIDQANDFIHEWTELYNGPFQDIKAIVEQTRRTYEEQTARERAEQEARYRRQQEERDRLARERLERQQREAEERLRLEQQIREQMAREEAAQAAAPRVVLRPISPNAPTTQQMNPFGEYIPDDEPFDVELDHILEELELEDAEEDEQIRREQAAAQAVVEPTPERHSPRVVLTPVDGRHVSDTEQARFNDILRQMTTGHRDHRDETAVTTEVMERMRVTNRPVRRDLWPDLSAMRRTVADEEANDVSALLRMIPNGDLVGDEWGIIELNARMGESIQLDAARLIAEARETVRVPDGIPVVNIQFDREMMSDIRSDSVEETIKQGPNGVYYIPKPAYFVHIDDSVTEFSDLESAKSMYASTTGESDVVVFYPVVDVEEQDLDGTVANETPEYVSALYLTVQHELQRALETHDDPLF